MRRLGTIEEVLAGEAEVAVVCGDAGEVIGGLPPACAHLCYCDSPYGLSEQRTAHVVACLTAWLEGRAYEHQGSGFMGESWDGFVPGPEVWRPAYRALKPGAFCVSYSSTRTADLLGISLRLSGFEIREGWAWLTGSAMTKSYDVSKAIDRAEGAEREVVGVRIYGDGHIQRSSVSIGYNGSDPAKDLRHVTAPATPAAALWDGYGTAVKPVYEPIVVAMRPADGPIAENVQQHGCGALNIDAARVGTGKRVPTPPRAPNGIYGERPAAAAVGATPGYDANVGRLPTSVAVVHLEGCRRVGTSGIPGDARRGGGSRPSDFLRIGSPPGDGRPVSRGYADDDGVERVDVWDCEPGCPAPELGAQSGVTRDGVAVQRNGGGGGESLPDVTYGGSGTAARFYYQAKASARDRLAYVTCTPGCPAHESVCGKREAAEGARRVITDGVFIDGVLWLLDEATATGSVCPACRGPRKVYLHPTVKPMGLARYHAKLLSLPAHVRPPALVPFCGTGPEVEALREVGYRVIAVDLDPRHCAMTRHRVSAGAAEDEPSGLRLPAPRVDPPRLKRRKAEAPTPQLDLFGGRVTA